MEIKKVAPRIACLITSLLVAGCAKPYLATEPVPGPSAKVRLIAQGAGYGLFSAVHINGHCKDMRSLGQIIGSENWNAKGDIEVSNLEMIDSSSIPNHTKIERKFRARVPLTIETQALTPARAVAGGIATSSCRITATFTPEPQGEYELAYNMSNGFCTLDISRLSLDAGNSVIRTPVTYVKQEHERCW
ncbi:hypothetical protein ACOAPY_10640 [Pseudomonas sp. P3C3]